MAPSTMAGLLALTALSSAAVPHQRRAPGAQTTQALFLPVEAPENQVLWASVITADATATQYLVACATASASPEACDGPYTGVTLTQGPKTMGVTLDGKTYGCSLGEHDGAVCDVSGQDTVETKTLAGTEWHDVAVAATAAAEPTDISYLEMRAPKRGGGGSRGKSSSKSKGKGLKGVFSDDDDEEDEDEEEQNDDSGNTGDSQNPDEDTCIKPFEDDCKGSGASVVRAGLGVAAAAMGFAMFM